MINAKIVAARLGYTPEFFEFPHYAATNKQMKMAEYYFNCIYQSYPRKELQNSITYTDSPQGKRIYYIPTPIDYVHNPKDVENTIKRIKNSVDKNYAVSMFFHPALDFNKENAVVISVDENTMTRKWSLSADSALKKIVTNIQNLGYKFTRLNTDGK